MAIDEKQVSDALTEVTSGVGFMFNMLCQHLDRTGVMSAQKFHEGLATALASGVVDDLREHRIMFQVIERIVDELGMMYAPEDRRRAERRWQPIVIEGGRKEGAD